MKTVRTSRRDFIKSLAAGAAGAKAAASGLLFGKPPSAGLDARGLPTAKLGKTGVEVPRIGIGLGSRFCAVENEDRALEILNATLDHGFYYWDTAYNYQNQGIISEERLGKVLERRRKEVFLATKFEERTRDGVLRQFEESLKRLRTDHLDLYQVHSLESLHDLDALAARGGALEALQRLKDEKATRFIGFSGHLNAAAMAEAARRHDFDTMLIALNHYQERKGDFEGGAIPAAAARGLGIMIIKSIRPRETVPGLAAEDLIRYALSLPLVHAAVVGTDSVEVVRKNAALLRNFRPLPAEDMKRIGIRLEPFFAGNGLPWMRLGYRDGEAC
jgi:aryl-alcohol dehydrogenase-like predicted oxidoreductase